MIPIDDNNPTHRAPLVTLLLIGACVAAFIWWIGLDSRDQAWSMHSLGLIPATIFGRMTLDPYIPDLPPGAPFLTAMFLHAGWIHLGGNVIYLWIFGNNVEDRLGHGRFLLFYLLAGIAGSAAYVALNPDSTTPMVGASGAISGVLGAYLVLYPLARVRTIIPPLFFRTFNVPVWAFLGFWLLFQAYGTVADLYLKALGTDEPPLPQEGGVAWAAYLVSFLAGIVLLLVLKPAGVKLFQRPAMRASADRGATARAGNQAAAGPWERKTGPTTRTSAIAIQAAASKQVASGSQMATTTQSSRPVATVASTISRRRGPMVQR
jgi:rhomboid family protein